MPGVWLARGDGVQAGELHLWAGPDAGKCKAPGWAQRAGAARSGLGVPPGRAGSLCSPRSRASDRSDGLLRKRPRRGYCFQPRQDERGSQSGHQRACLGTDHPLGRYSAPPPVNMSPGLPPVQTTLRLGAHAGHPGNPHAGVGTHGGRAHDADNRSSRPKAISCERRSVVRDRGEECHCGGLGGRDDRAGNRLRRPLIGASRGLRCAARVPDR